MIMGHKCKFSKMNEIKQTMQDGTGRISKKRVNSSPHLQRHHQEIIFPVAFIDPIGKIAVEWHTLIVGLKLQISPYL